MLMSPFQPTLDDSLETKVVKFLESVDPKDEESVKAFLSSLTSFSDKSMTNFVQSIGTLISTPNEAITTSTMKMLLRLTLTCSDEILFALVKADLVSQLIVTLDPHSVSLSDCEDIHSCLIHLIECSLWLSSLDDLAPLEIEDSDEHQTVPETIFQKVLSPSEKYICHLCVNRYSILDHDQYTYVLILLGILLQSCPYHQMTMKTVLVPPVILAIPSCFSFIEAEVSVWRFLDILVQSQSEWDEIGDGHQAWKNVSRMLRMEGMEDVMEEKLGNDKDDFYARNIVADSIELNNLFGMNVPELE
ncbi:hypothetical protein BLNAU_16575 [Blattamonas nauphoetae]|uniref:Uncharacterized protein n=1 Tax=Blattamonas nauphoetae TaxID=2049346 RepID=A0ABQ9XDW7_9EUKA|nr:hypothetical protein BLNAU_16575 [Blattamonas nauphoetae]